MSRQSEPRCRASVIIVTYNNRHEIEACVRSVVSSLGETDELILVDNNSNDGTPELALSIQSDLRMVRSPVNLGLGGGANLAAQQAKGEFLVFLNPDTTVELGWLDALTSALQGNLEAGLATPKILLIDDPGRINTCGNLMHISGLTLCRGMGEPSQAYPALEEVGAVSGAAFAIRRDAFEKLDGFDASFFLYVEETDLSLRARLAGYRILYVPEAVIYHDYRLTFGPLKTYYQERNRYQMLLKVLRRRTLLALLPALLLAELVTWGFVFVRERRNQANKLLAYVDLIKGWEHLRAARKRTQALRRVSDGELLRLMHFRLAYEQTGGGLISTLSHWLFDPLFWVAGWFARILGRILCV